MGRYSKKHSRDSKVADYQVLEPRQLLAADVLAVSSDGVWQNLSQDVAATSVGTNLTKAETFSLFDLQENALFDRLNNAPLEFTPGFEANAVVLSIPTPNGDFESFAIVEAPVMHEDLAAQFPNIKTYRGVGIDQPAAAIRLDYTDHGFHAQVLSPDGQYYVDPYYHLQTDLYQSYYNQSLARDPANGDPSELLLDDNGEVLFGMGDYANLVTNGQNDSAMTTYSEGDYTLDEQGNAWIQEDDQWHKLDSASFHFHGDGSIHVNDGNEHEDVAFDDAHHEFADGEVECTGEGCNCPNCLSGSGESSFAPDFGSELRTYETAVATTGEYTQFHGGTVSQGLSAVTTAINRVTGVLEKDLGIRLELVPNNQILIFTNSVTDGYTNNNGPVMLGQNQAKLDSTIGNANYDLGHVFSTGGGGIAGLGVIGRTGLKAQGVTGLPSPVGDAFYIDFVAHEMGHQFGAEHTFNGDSGSCATERSGGSAYEPGSGSTIMGYSGICGNDNLQNRADKMYHSHSIDQIRTRVTTGVGNSSAEITDTGNTIPTVDAGQDYVIPDQTPFELTATSSDPDGTTLTHSWEQRDRGAQRDVNASDNGSSPIFRTFNPTISSTRSFPKLLNVIQGNTVTGEQYPTTNWNTMDFRVVLRDNSLGGGGVVSDDMRVQVVNSGSGFNVTSQSTTSNWTGLETETITWNVAGTTANGIDTPNVDIYFAANALAYDVVLATGVPNDGSHDIIVPNINAFQGRVKVKGSGNIFYDINQGTILIDPVAELPKNIDFGPVGSNPYLDYTQVNDQAYSAANGYGWLSTTGFFSFEGGRGSDLTRDSARVRQGTFAIDVPNDTYTVRVVLGIVFKQDLMRLEVEGEVDQFDPPNGPNIVRTFTADVTDGQLTIAFDGLNGLNNRFDVSGIEFMPAASRPSDGSSSGDDEGGSSFAPLELNSTDPLAGDRSLSKFAANTNMDFNKRPNLQFGDIARLAPAQTTHLAQLTGAVLNSLGDELEQANDWAVVDPQGVNDVEAFLELELELASQK